MNINTYNLPFNISRVKSKNIPKINAKRIICNHNPPVQKSEYYLKNIADAYQFLKNNVTYLVDKNLFIKTYFLLAGTRLSAAKAIDITEQYYVHLNSCWIERLFYILKAVNKSIRVCKTEYALLLINYFFQRDYNHEITLYPALFNRVKKMFSSDEATMELILCLKGGAANNDNTIQQNITLDDIKFYFEEYKNQILCRFPINRLYVFGSYADDTAHQSSDLDILVEFNADICPMQDDLLRNDLAEYITQTLNISVDVLSLRYVVESMDVTSINKIISIY